MPWELTGNRGTNPTTNFLGTADNQPLVIGTNGAERLRITPDGSVGIGTASPGANARLNVVGGAIAVASSPFTADAAIHINSSFGGFDRLLQMAPGTGASKPGLSIVASTDAAGNAQWWAWGVTPDNKWRIQSGTTFNGSGGLTINTAGNVGIGTPSPVTALHLPERGLQIGYSATDTDNFHLVSDVNFGSRALRLYNRNYGGGWILMTVTPGGNVGIGSTSPPITALHLPERGLQIGYSGAPADNFHFTSDTVGGARGLRLWNGNYGSGVHILTALSNGNVGIGTLVPARPLHISSPGNDILLLQSTRGGAGNTANLDFQTYATIDQIHPTASIRAIDAGGWSSHIALLTKDIGANTNALSERMRISTDGNVGIGTTNPQARLDVSGDVHVSGDVVLANADCAEEFDVAEDQEVEPGTVMVLDENGTLRPSQRAHDKRVAGVVSGAGDYAPAIVLDKQPSEGNRVPLALIGKVFCKVDASYSSIEVGDLLTTSPTLGSAMKATDSRRAFGTVIGKALRSLRAGQGLIPVMVARQ